MDTHITAPTDISLTSNDDKAKSTELDPKPLLFTNGLLKRNRHLTNAVAYMECLKNHAAALGGHALDGCCEFMLSPSTNPNLPTSLKCAACGCHRNFHRREPEDSPSPLQLLTPPPLSTTTASHVIEYQPLHRHHPPLPLPPARATSPYPPSPPPISSSYYPSSAPHMLLALSQQALGVVAANPVSGSGRKRFRTKFSNLQKQKMYELAERVGWKLQRRDEEVVNEFCNGAGVGREVFKVWMHNNKSTLGKRSSSADAGNNNGFFPNGIHHHEDVNNIQVNTTEQHTITPPPHHSLVSHNNLNGDDMVHHHSEGSGGHVTTNGSFSSS